MLERSIDVCCKYVENLRFACLRRVCRDIRYSERLPDIGPKCEILPSQGRGSGPGSNRDIIRFDFFLLSAWEYSMPYHPGLGKSKLDLGYFFIKCMTLWVS